MYDAITRFQDHIADTIKHLNHIFVVIVVLLILLN